MKITLRLLGAAALVLVLVGCQGSAENSSHAPSFQLKLYHVPVEQSDAIAQNLRSALVNGAYLVGRKDHTEMQVKEAFPGAILVLAPTSLQPSIGAAIDDMNKTLKAAPGTKTEATATKAASTTLHAHFWVVNAMAGAGTNDPTLKPLSQTLSQVGNQLGPSHFLLDGSASAVATMGNHSVIDTGSYQFDFAPEPNQSGSITLQVRYSAAPTLASKLETASGQASAGISKLEVTVATQPGQYVILAQAPIHTATDPDHQDKASPRPIMRLLVMRVDQTQPTTH